MRSLILLLACFARVSLDLPRAVVVKVTTTCAMLALAACGESQPPYSVCTPRLEDPNYWDQVLYGQEDDDPEKTTEADRTRANDRMSSFHGGYAHCWERVANEIISMGGTDDAAKAQAEDNCDGALSMYRGASYRYHSIDRELHIGGDSDDAWEDVDRDVAAFSRSLDLRLAAFRLCYANRNKLEN